MTSNPMDEVLGRWKAAFDDHDVEAMADLFHPDALFLGFDPEVLVGRQMVRAYYDAVPDDRSADVTVLHTYSIGQGAAGGFAHVVFRDPTRLGSPGVPVPGPSAQRGFLADPSTPRVQDRPTTLKPEAGLQRRRRAFRQPPR